MPANARQYRDHLYRTRSHTEAAAAQADAGSFAAVQLSVLPFLICEYLAERNYDVLPSGLVFPVGFLIFWAFYFTYYQPGFLEHKLSGPRKWDNVGIPSVIVGGAIWFVKIMVVELTETLLTRGIFGPRKVKGPTPNNYRKVDFTKGREGYRAQANQASRTANPHTQTKPAQPTLPAEITHALAVLGLTDCRDWDQIHRRYRELAKKSHPDLNPELSNADKKFMAYDSAYRKLHAVRAKYFPERRSHG